MREGRQEGKIEKDLRAIEDKWAATVFSVVKYSRGGPLAAEASTAATAGGSASSCPVLRAADDIKLELDDTLLNLQAIAGSKFVVTFAAR